VRITNGRHECALCGADLKIPITTKPQSVIADGTDRSRVRVLLVKGEEIHRCEMPSQKQASIAE
jgi:hypothetical protein